MTRTFDLHDQAYDIWRDAGGVGEVLVHIDAHHDAAKDPAWLAIDIGNYVRAAIRDGMVASVHWIAPDPIWRDRATRARLLSELNDIGDRGFAVESDGARATIEGAPLWLGPLEAMPAISGPVLLDIDTDYLLTAGYHKNGTAEPLARPWCWPDEFVSRVQAKIALPRITTIATSVTGGFTPLRWAHLAREIGARLERTPPAPLLACYAALRMAADLRETGDGSGALNACLEAVSVCPTEAASHFHLAESLQAAGRLEEGRAAFARAREIDPSYAHPFRTRGPYLYRRGRLREAETAYRDGLALDPTDSHAQLGLAMVAIRQGRAADARRLAEQSLAGAPEAVDAWRTLSEALARLGERRPALLACQRALALSLHGAPPLRAPWATNRDRRLLDPRHWHDHSVAGDLHASLGDLDAAIAHYRIAASGAPAVRRLRRRLALLRARRQLGRAFGGVLPS